MRWALLFAATAVALAACAAIDPETAAMVLRGINDAGASGALTVTGTRVAASSLVQRPS